MFVIETIFMSKTFEQWSLKQQEIESAVAALP